MPCAAVLVALFVGPPSHGQAPQSGDPTNNTISGTVLNSVTREPIGHALVYSSDDRYAAFTDDRGHFEFTLVAQPAQPTIPVMTGRFMGQTVLLAKKPGFLTDLGPRGSAVMSPGDKDMTLSLVPEALILGQVKFSTETADKANVQLYRREVRDGIARWDPVPPKGTRSNGEFRFAELRPGEYKLFTLEAVEQDPLTAVPNGPVYAFPPRYYAVARDFGAADTIQLHAGEVVTANIAPERQRYYDVRVPLLGVEPGAPAGKEVSVFAQGHRGPGFELGFDPNQGAIVGSLPNGSYTIEVSSYEPASATALGNITVANGPVTGPPLTLVANPSIEIKVRQDLPAGQPTNIAGMVNVLLQSADEFNGGSSNYPSQGEPPSLTGVKPGRYWVQANVGAGNAYVASVTSGGRDLSRSPLVVPIGASIPPIEVTVRYEAGEIEATIDGNPPAKSSGVYRAGGNAGAFPGSRGLSVYCLPLVNDGGAVRELYVRPDGISMLSQLPPGDYRLLAFDTPQQLEYRNSAAMRAYDSKGQVVHIEPGEKAQVKLQVIKSE